MKIPMDYVAVDIETTGLYPKYDKIIEIGAARVRDGKVEDTFSVFVNPGQSLLPKIVELTGIHDQDVCEAPYIEQVFQDFMAFVGQDVLLGHNLLFDYAFLKRAATNQKIPFQRTGIDTLHIARKFLDKLESRNLGFLCAYYHIELEAHRALNDAIAAHQLYQIFAAQYTDKEEEGAVFQPKPLVYQAKKENPATPKQLAFLRQLAVRHKLNCEEMMLAPIENVTEVYTNLEKLTKNEASRLIDKLLANFGR